MATDLTKWTASLEKRGMTAEQFRVLTEMIWPDTDKYQIPVEYRLMAVDYCKARELDPLKRVVHIIPFKGKFQIIPAVSEHLTTAARTNEFAGKDDTEFGHVEVRPCGFKSASAPEWARVTIYRLVQGRRVPFTATARWSEACTGSPIWQARPFQMLEKCALAAALRVGFPEEIGGEPTYEELHGEDARSPKRPTEAQIDALDAKAEAVLALQEAEPEQAEAEPDPIDVYEEPPYDEELTWDYQEPPAEPVVAETEKPRDEDALMDLRRRIMSASQGLTNDTKKRAVENAFCPEVSKGTRWGEYVKGLGAGDAERLLDALKGLTP